MGMDAEGRRGGKGKENSALVSTQEKEKSRHLTHSLPPNISLSTPGGTATEMEGREKVTVASAAAPVHVERRWPTYTVRAQRGKREEGEKSFQEFSRDLRV